PPVYDGHFNAVEAFDADDFKLIVAAVAVWRKHVRYFKRVDHRYGHRRYRTIIRIQLLADLVFQGISSSPRSWQYIYGSVVVEAQCRVTANQCKRHVFRPNRSTVELVVRKHIGYVRRALITVDTSYQVIGSPDFSRGHHHRNGGCAAIVRIDDIAHSVVETVRSGRCIRGDGHRTVFLQRQWRWVV